MVYYFNSHVIESVILLSFQITTMNVLSFGDRLFRGIVKLAILFTGCINLRLLSECCRSRRIMQKAGALAYVTSASLE